MKILNLSRVLNTSINTTAGRHSHGPRFYGSVVRPTRPLQIKKDEEAREKTIQAAEAVKESAESVAKAAKQVSAKVSETTDTIKEKASDALISGAWNAAKSTASKIMNDKTKGN